jgi:poly(A) polymerase
MFAFPEKEQFIIDKVTLAAQQLDYPTFLIGGYVRDKLMGIPVQDMDIVCRGSGIKLAQKTAELLDPVPKVKIFKNFGTAMFNYKGYDIEFVGARKESYNRDSRKPVVEDGSIEDDQNRRDFTINAMGISLCKENFGELSDPFDGQKDLEKRLIRTPLNPDITFSDDPLRMMRAARFAAQLNFKVEKETLLSIARNKERIHIISQERITDELNKCIMSGKPSTGFRVLFETGLLEIIFPELYNLHGIDIINGSAHKDNFFHTLKVLDNLCKNSDNLMLRWAALLHDIAKPQTKRFNRKAGWTFHGHDAIGAKMVPDIFRRMKLPLHDKMEYVQKMVLLHLRPISLSKEEVTDSAIRRLLFEAGDDIDDLIKLCEADITSKNKQKVKKYIANFGLVREKLKTVEDMDKLKNWQPPISGALIMETFGIRPSKTVGEIKDKIRDAILDGEIKNDYNEAFQLMINIGKELGLEQNTRING